MVTDFETGAGVYLGADVDDSAAAPPLVAGVNEGLVKRLATPRGGRGGADDSSGVGGGLLPLDGSMAALPPRGGTGGAGMTPPSPAS